MASKLLNVRMDEEMLQNLKEVCGELGINVTDAIKSFSKELIEKKKLPEIKKEKKEEMTIEELFKDMADFDEVRDIKEFEKMNEDISDTVFSYYKKLRNFIFDKAFECESYSEIIEIFRKNFGKEFEEKITDRIAHFSKEYYDDIIDSYGEVVKEENDFKNEKYISIMENLYKENKELYNELLDKYSYNLSSSAKLSLNCNNYYEIKKKLEKLLTPEERKEYVLYEKGLDNCKNAKEREAFYENLRNDKERTQNLGNILKKLEENNTEDTPKKEYISWRQK